MGFVPVVNLSGDDKIPALLDRDIPQKESISISFTDISSGLVSFPQKSSLLDYLGASAQIAKNLLLASSASEAIKLENKKKKIEFLQKESNRVQEFDVHFENDLTINGVALFLEANQKKDFQNRQSQDQKWMIYFNNNESFYETELASMLATGKDFEANVLVFNYRGVGESCGTFSNISDLLIDAELCLRYLFFHGINEKNILFQGHALGAAVGMQLAALYVKIGMIAIACFSCLSVAASARVRFSGQFLASFGWDIDCLNAYMKINSDKLLVYHKQDGVVPYHESSLYKALKEKIKQLNPDASELRMHKGIIKNRLKAEYKPLRVKLSSPFDAITDAAHNYPLSSDLAYGKIKEFATDFFTKT